MPSVTETATQIKRGDAVSRHETTAGGPAQPHILMQLLAALAPVLSAAPQAVEKAGVLYWRISTQVCHGGFEPHGLHLWEAGDGIGARCWPNGLQLSGPESGARCNFGSILVALERLTGLVIPRPFLLNGAGDGAKATASKRTMTGGESEIMAHSHVSVYHPGMVVLAGMIKPAPDEFFRGSDLHAEIAAAVAAASERIGLRRPPAWRSRQILMAAREICADPETFPYSAPMCREGKAFWAYEGWCLTPLDDAGIETLADALRADAAVQRTQDEREEGIVARIHSSQRATSQNPRALLIHPRALKQNPRARGTNVLAQLVVEKRINDSPLTPIKCRGAADAAFLLGGFQGRVGRLKVPDCCGVAVYPEGIAVDIADGCRADARSVWRYSRVGVAEPDTWHVSGQLPSGAVAPQAGDLLAVETRAGEVHSRVVERVVALESWGRLGTRYTCAVVPDQAIAQRAMRRRDVWRRMYLLAAAEGVEPEWPGHGQDDGIGWRDDDEGDVPAMDPSVTFTDVMDCRRWLLMTPEKGPAAYLPGSPLTWVTTTTPSLWTTFAETPNMYRLGVGIPAFCMADDGDECPDVVILDVDYHPEKDLDGEGVGTRDEWLWHLRLYPQSVSKSGWGRHVVVAIHPDDRVAWRRLRGEKIRGPERSGCAIDLYPKGTPQYVGLRRIWVDARGHSVAYDESAEIPVLRVRDLICLDGAVDVLNRCFGMDGMVQQNDLSDLGR